MRYLAHGECLSRRPCKDCDLRFSLQYVKDHFPHFIPPLGRGGQEGSGKQRSDQTPLPCLYPHRGEGVYLKRFLILFFKLPLALRAAAMRAAASLPALVRWSRWPS